MSSRSVLLALLACLALASVSQARLDVKRYEDLREAERYQMDIAERLFDQQKWDGAQGEYEKFLELYPKSVGAAYAQFMVAACCERQRLINQAIKEYKNVISYYPDAPDSPPAALAVARCHAANGESELAVQQFMNVVAQYPDQPVAGNALWEAAEVHIAHGLDEKAAELRRKLVETYPKSDRFQPAVDWLVDYYLYKADDINSARTVCKLLRSPLDTERHLSYRLYEHGYRQYNWYGKGDDGKKFMDKAAAVYSAIPTQFPDQKPACIDALGMVGQCYRYSGRLDKALAAFQVVVKEAPDDDNWRENYGICLDEANKHVEARLEFSKLKDRGRSAFQIAQSYHRERNVAEAEAAYMRVVNEFPDRAKQSLYCIGDLHHYISGNYERAINAYRQSEWDPPQYLFRIGECFSSAKQYDMAIKTYQEIVGFFKDWAPPEALWRIADVCDQKGDKEGAIAALRRIGDRYPGSGRSSDAHQRLKNQYGVQATLGGESREQK